MAKVTPNKQSIEDNQIGLSLGKQHCARRIASDIVAHLAPGLGLFTGHSAFMDAVLLIIANGILAGCSLLLRSGSSTLLPIGLIMSIDLLPAISATNGDTARQLHRTIQSRGGERG